MVHLGGVVPEADHLQGRPHEALRLYSDCAGKGFKALRVSKTVPSAG